MQIIYQDPHLIAINKPPGLLVHRSKIDRTETRFALQLVRDLIGQPVYPLHRLDKPTSGVLLFALNKEMAAKMSQLFFSGGIGKQYLAVCRGFICEQGRIEYALKEQLDKMTDANVSQDKQAQSAITEYKRLASVELPFAAGRYQSSRYSLVLVQPLTGRKHQIRRHMKHIFHPIVGDTTHGDGKHNTLFRDRYHCHRLLLHSSQLRFVHPCSNHATIIKAPLEGDFKKIIDDLGWGNEIWSAN